MHIQLSLFLHFTFSTCSVEVHGLTFEKVLIKLENVFFN